MRAALLILVVVVLSVAAPAGAHKPGSGEWSWTPALCKSYLKEYGVRIDDGRTFRAVSVFCGGLPSCTHDLSAKVFYYDHFSVAMIDGNLVYRTMTLHVTKETSFRVTDLRVHGRAKTLADKRRFEREAKALVALVSRETQADCTIEP